MANDRKIYKPRPVSGFPEWLPEVRIVEQQWLDHIRRVFESYGFCSIETPSVEEIEVLQAKGEVDKEIYVLERLHKEDGDKDARLALHFDQTVPLARYVGQHWDKLSFPFKRYQMQRVWRGERPQAGRFREFTQCDIDVINNDALPLFFDAEMPAIIWEILTALPGMATEKIRIRISNRKILIGLVQSLGIEDVAAVTRTVDKLEKIGRDGVSKALSENGLAKDQVDSILGLATATDLAAIKPQGALMEEGLKELSFVMDQLKHLPSGGAVADLSIIRGLDYYTGTVYETVFTDDPTYGSICSGGRYDDLASSYINKKLPGVGISIGFSRLFAYLHEKGKLPSGAKSSAHILMALFSEDARAATSAKAQALRAKGLNVDLYHSPRKLPDQLKYAEKKGIPFVYLPGENGDEIKDMAARDQVPATEQKLAEILNALKK